MFGILPIIGKTPFDAMRWDSSDGMIYFVFNERFLNDTDFIKNTIIHELEHALQLSTKSQDFINQNDKQLKVDQNMAISEMIGNELGAYLKSNFNKKEDSFEDWYDNFFAEKFKLIRMKSGFIFSIYFKHILDLFPQFAPLLEEHFLAYLKLYKTEIQHKLKNGQSIENVIIWLRSNRLKLD